MSEVRFTVFTPIYNRRHTIHRVFDSLMRQTCKDFEWLVIDDGSTDNVKELIDEYAAKADFPVRYYYKENGGKHTAVNMAYGLIETPFFTILDSDDAFTDDAVEKLLQGWESIPESQRDRYWSVVGHSVDSQTGELIGERFSAHANDPNAPAEKVVGEKTAALRTDVMRQYPFPEPQGTTFVTESIVWNKVGKAYKQYYLNEIIRIYYQNEPDSLMVAWYRDHVQEGYVSNFIWKQSILNDVGIRSVHDLFILCQYTFYGVMAAKPFREIVGGLDKRLYRFGSTLLWLPAKCVRALRRLRAR